jgi:hypothetical protein
LKSFPTRDSAQGALHVSVDDLEAVDVGGVDPAESVWKWTMLVGLSFVSVDDQGIMLTLLWQHP